MTGVHLANHLTKEKSRLGVEGRDFVYACSRSNEFALVPSIVGEYVQNVNLSASELQKQDMITENCRG